MLSSHMCLLENKGEMMQMKSIMFVGAISMGAFLSFAGTLDVSMLPGEHWWGGANNFGGQMPYSSASVVHMDLTKSNYSNQFSSFLVSDKGRYVWCDEQTQISISNGVIRMTAASATPQLIVAGRTLREAFLAAAAKHFPSSGKSPDPLFFSAPQYNTWIELTYFQSQDKIMEYAKSMIDNGLPPGVFMVDDTWQEGYGTWEFNPRTFPNPKEMCDELHKMGFKVMLWICPWVSMDSPAYRRIVSGINPGSVVREKHTGGFYLGTDGLPAASRWWNGQSALLDFTHPNANRWFQAQLDRLVKDYGVDGFKFDGGELGHYVRGGLKTHDPTVSTADQTYLYGKYALEYRFSEYRNAWRLQGQPVVVRLIDKDHSWKAVRALVTDMIAGGLLGYPFVCPDMVGGGSWTAFLPGAPFDAELFVRSAQVHALCGQMQFSASPWRVLDDEKKQIVRDTVKIRQKFAQYFVELSQECGRTGEPMIRNLEYVFPGRGYATVVDEFMMGDKLLVAPVMEKGKRERKVILPPGTWKADDGMVFEGPKEITVKAPLSRLPHFVKR